MQEWRPITSRFDNSICRSCRQPIPKGQPAMYLKGAGIMHPACHDKQLSPRGPDTPIGDAEVEDGNGGGQNADGQDNGQEQGQGEQQSDDGQENGQEQQQLQQSDGKQKRNRKPNPRKELIRKALEKQTPQEVKWGELREAVNEQNEPMIYRQNTGDGERAPAPMEKQRKMFEQEVNDIYREMQKQGQNGQDEQPSEGQDEQEQQQETPEKHEDEREWYLAQVRHLRNFCERSARAGQVVDTISMRPVVEGNKAYKVGLPLAAMVDAITKHWSSETRDSAGVEEFDPLTLCTEDDDSRHRLMPYIRKLAEARIPIMLVGEKGTGKSYLAGQLAGELEIPYAYLSLNGAATPSWFFGSYTPDPVQPYKTRPFKEIYRNGGVFCVDEIDAAEPNMLLILNNLISADHLECPMTGERIEKHPDFIVVATANTFGLGANRDYQGRERLDAATLDRFRMGRVVVKLDEALERRLMFA